MNKKICLLLIAFTSFFANAAKETYSVRKDAIDFTSSFTMTIIDGQFASLLPAPAPIFGKSQDLVLKLGIDEGTNYGYIPAFTYSVNVKITPFTIANVAEPPIYTTLSIDYSPAGGLQTINLNYFKTSDYHKYEIKVIPNFALTPANVYIEAELTIDRFYEISQTVPLVGSNFVYHDPNTNVEYVVFDVNQQPLPGFGELEIWWDYIVGAEEYELEWTWIDNYDQVGTVKFNENNFEKNNTRIITTSQSHRIPLIFAEGYLIYRVRGVGRWTDNNLNDTDIRKFGVWSTDGASIDGSSTIISDWPHYIELESAHEVLKNWQYQAVYAEDGKKKEIVSYYDGSLRNRQTVTRINSDYQAIVGETVYDNQGRSAIQILPAPTGNSALKYYQSLNLNNSGDPYSHRDFDWELVGSIDCSVGSDAMSTLSGASKYYSSNNAFSGSWQDYVPRADEYPFVQVEYTPDNTGRIRAQSGVGDEYKIDGDHATSYHYVQPYQEELNRLFGYEVGYKSRYKKNMVVDANGQVSISYIDPQGRVIATALAGTNTTGTAETTTHLESLDEEVNGNHGVNEVDLLNKFAITNADTEADDNLLYSSGANGPLNDVLKLNTQVSSADNNNPHIFTYKVQNFTYDITCTESLFKYPLAYDLTIDLRDDCGNSVFVAGPIELNVDGLNPSNDYLNSSGDTYTLNNTVNLNVGSYSLSKVLQVDQQKLNEYVLHYIQNNECLYTLEDFLTIEDCVQEPMPPAESELEITSCFSTNQMMLNDMSPYGQYGSDDPSDLASIFSEINIFSDGIPSPIDAAPDNLENWRNPVTPYLDAYSNPSLIQVTEVSPGVYSPALIPGAAVDPGTFPGQYLALPQYLASVQYFFSEWEPSWANSLLPYHPEYKYLNYVNDLCALETTSGAVQMSSESYNNSLQEVTLWSDAIAATNLSNINLVDNPYSGNFTIYENDPYFNLNYPHISTANNALKAEFMEVILENYKNSGLSLWEFCVKAIICGTDISGTCTVPFSTMTGLIGTATPDQLDQIWGMYKQTYLAEKRKIDQIFMDIYALENSAYNQYIGNENPTIPGITAYLYYATEPVTGGNMLAVIVDLYLDAFTLAATNAGTTDFFSWTANPYSSLFTDKQERFVRIDNLYDATIPEMDMITATAEETNSAIFAQTGRCDLSYDVEYLINGLATGDHLPASAINSNDLPAFTQDLNLAMQGVPPSTVIITSASIGSAVQITTNSLGSFIQVNNPTAPGASWNDVIEVSNLYYVPNSYNSGTNTYDFKVLVSMMVGTNYVEEVLDGVTTVQIGECSYEPVCDKEENFGSNLGAIFTELSDQTLPYSSTLTSLVGGWYETSELLSQLQDNALTATINASSTGFSIESTTRKITVTYSGLFSSSAIITGATCNADGSILSINYINTSGLNQTLTATVTYQAILAGPAYYPITPNFECACSAEVAAMEASFTNLFNYVLDGNVGDPIFLPTPELAAVDVYVANSEPLLVSDSYLATGQFRLDFILSPEVPCSLEFSINSSDISPLQTILNLDSYVINGKTYFSATGMLANGSIVQLEAGRIPCLDYTPCSSCDHPSVPVPVSCTDSYAAYMAVITPLNANILSIDQDKFKEYTEEEFCETNLAYVTEAYLNYISLFSIINTEHNLYLSLAEFSNTALNYGFYDATLDDDLADVVSLYHAYMQANTKLGLTWANYVSDIYLVQNNVCPPPVTPTYYDTDLTYPCDPLTQNVNVVNAVNQYQIYLENTVATFKQVYLEKAMSTVIENFDMKYNDKEYHYTLYYYDQAGNLIQTVPPQGVDRIEDQIQGTTTAQIQAALDLKNSRKMNTEIANPDILPVHTYQTNYHYNSLNQLVSQKTPDGGESFFAYDALGRLVVSQNEKQANIGGGEEQFSYTKYDGLGRIIEVGEMTVTDDYGFNENGKLIEDGTGDLVDVSDPDFPLNLNAEREEIVVTVYDELNGISPSEFYDYSADNTRNRITGVKYYYAPVSSTTALTSVVFTNATFYDYDVHGNVKEVIQVNNDPELAQFNSAPAVSLVAVNGMKKTRYEYDLVSGNVKEVAYQKEEADQFIHRYTYDADNRITNVETTRDEVIYEQDAKYFYYEHGPLARTEIGDQKVAGSDFAYTVQGWLKGVNSEYLKPSIDQGRDGFTTNINKMNGTDVYGYSLHYFDEDYKARFGNDFLAFSTLSPATPDQDLFNGNIKQMYTANTDFDENYIGTSHTTYKYDQLNRILSMNQTTLGVTNQPSGFASAYSYDKNGNLMTLERWKGEIGGASTLMDNMAYTYVLNQYGQVSNRLGHVTDPVDAAGVDDITGQLANNYKYDRIGQLTSDDAENIQSIEWTVTGKVDKIFYSTGPIDYIDFEYDAMGNRIEKKIVYLDAKKNTATYYFLDAQGNVMAVYTDLYNNNERVLKLSEQHIYGSSRVGLQHSDREIIASMRPLANAVYMTPNETQLIGDKSYELSNHLGNVLEVISDRKLPVTVTEDRLNFSGATNQYVKKSSSITATSVGITSKMTIEGWVKTTGTGNYSVAAYYNGGTVNKGMVLGINNGIPNLTGRNNTLSGFVLYATTNVADGNWHYLVATADNNGSNVVWKIYVDGQLENTSTGANGTFTGMNEPFYIGANVYGAYMNGNIKEVSWWNAAKSDAQVANDYYNYAGYTGLETGLIGYWKMDEGAGTILNDAHPTNNNDLAFYTGPSNYPTWTPDTYLDYYLADVVSYSDYYPFGSELPGRNGSVDDYRYSFNGKENDEEVSGSGNTIDFGARIYDSRVGRWLSRDPHDKGYPSLSPYSFVANTPLIAIDPDGRDIVIIGSDEYKAQVMQILENLATQSGTGAQLIWDAINSGATIVIVNTAEDVENSVNGIGPDYYLLTFNIDVASQPLNAENGRNGEPLDMPAEVTMAHELSHFLSPQKSGMLVVDDKSTGINADEVNAVETENQVRREMGLPERTHYKGVEVYGKQIVPSTKYKGYYELKSKPDYAPTSKKTYTNFDWQRVYFKTEPRMNYYYRGRMIDAQERIKKGGAYQTRIYGQDGANKK